MDPIFSIHYPPYSRRSFWQRCITRLTEGMSGFPGSKTTRPLGAIIEIDMIIMISYD